MTSADKRPRHSGTKKTVILIVKSVILPITGQSCSMTLNTDLQLVVVPLECPAMSEVVLRMPRVGGTTPSSAWVRGTELARVETRRRSG